MKDDKDFCYIIIELLSVLALDTQCSCGSEIVLWQAQLWGLQHPFYV